MTASMWTVALVFALLGIMVGHWLFRSREELVCTVCGTVVYPDTNHCPECGNTEFGRVEAPGYQWIAFDTAPDELTESVEARDDQW